MTAPTESPVSNGTGRSPHGDGSPDPERAPTPDTEAVLELQNVTAGYRQFKALFDVSLRVEPASAVALIGPNGVGKTTVARVATGLVAPTGGSVIVDGVDMTGRSAYEFARAGVAHAPEGRSVFATLTVEENLNLPFRQRFGRAGLAGAMDEAYEHFPILRDRRKQAAGSLSGGEQRMLTLARVLVIKPTVLVADELSLGLAPIITHEVYRVLDQIRAAGTALLVIEQHIDHALALADRIVVLERGRVIYTGEPDTPEAKAAVFPRGEDVP
jgi:branched-chain amino acid transport system ATP-binding protein